MTVSDLVHKKLRSTSLEIDPDSAAGSVVDALAEQWSDLQIKAHYGLLYVRFSQSVRASTECELISVGRCGWQAYSATTRQALRAESARLDFRDCWLSREWCCAVGARREAVLLRHQPPAHRTRLLVRCLCRSKCISALFPRSNRTPPSKLREPQYRSSRSFVKGDGSDQTALRHSHAENRSLGGAIRAERGRSHQAVHAVCAQQPRRVAESPRLLPRRRCVGALLSLDLLNGFSLR